MNNVVRLDDEETLNELLAFLQDMGNDGLQMDFEGDKNGKYKSAFWDGYEFALYYVATALAYAKEIDEKADEAGEDPGEAIEEFAQRTGHYLAREPNERTQKLYKMDWEAMGFDKDGFQRNSIGRKQMK